MKHVFPLVALLLLMLPIGSSADEKADKFKKYWSEKIKKTSLEFAEKKKNELVQEGSKKAIIAIYKKIYPQLKNKSEREALNMLGDLGMNASRLNSLASDLASGDPKKVQNASELLAVDVGTKAVDLARLGRDSSARMKALLGKAGMVKDVSSHLGTLAGGNAQPLCEYAGDLIIKAAGGANVVGFYRTAYGVMKYSNDAFVDSTIEDFYQQYKKAGGNLDPDWDTIDRHHFTIRDKIIAEKKKKASELKGMDIPPALRAHLTRVDEAEFKRRLLAGFKARAMKEKKAELDKVAAAKAAAQAEEILAVLQFTAQGQGKDSWASEDSGVPMKFIELVRRKAAEDPYFDPDNTRDLRAMGRLFANQLVHGVNSPEFNKALGEFNRYRDIRRGGDEPDTDWSKIFGDIAEQIKDKEEFFTK